MITIKAEISKWSQLHIFMALEHYLESLITRKEKMRNPTEYFTFQLFPNPIFGRALGNSTHISLQYSYSISHDHCFYNNLLSYLEARIFIKKIIELSRIHVLVYVFSSYEVFFALPYSFIIHTCNVRVQICEIPINYYRAATDHDIFHQITTLFRPLFMPSLNI